MRASALFGILAIISLAACVSPLDAGEPGLDRGPATDKQWFIPAENATDGRPAFRSLPAKVSKLSAVANGSNPADPGGTLVRIRVWDNRAYITNHGAGGAVHSVLVWDVSSPLEPRWIGSAATGHERPVLPDPVGGMDGSTFQGLDVLNYGNRTVVAASIWTEEGSFQSEQGPVAFWDVTDPNQIRELARIRIYSSTLAAHRPAHLVYSSNYGPANRGVLDIIDATDPDKIRLAATWPWPTQADDGTSIAPSWCQGLHLDHAEARLYCAASAQTLVLDVSSPMKPRVLTAASHAEMPHPGFAFPILDGRVLAVMDGVRRAASAANAATQANYILLFDLTKTPPTFLGRVRSEATPTITPQFATEIGHGTGMLAVAGGAGFFLVDASEPASPRIVQEDGSAGFLGDVFYYGGLVFASGPNGLLVLAPEQ